MRKYNILFVDDEEVIRESFLKLVDWEAYQFDVAGVFKNGETAWEYISEHPVDIVVTDINMPFMTGIDLLENIRIMKSNIRVLLLTGYEYFEYAQKAVQLKAFDFLMKPVTTERLLNAVEKAVLDIEKEAAAAEAVENNKELSRSYFVNQLLNGKLVPEEIEEKSRALSFPVNGGSYLVMVMAVDSAKGEPIPEREAEELKRSLQDWISKKKLKMEEQLGKSFVLYFARNISLHIRMVLATENSNLFTEEFTESFARLLLQADEKKQEYRLTVAAGKTHFHMEELPNSFQDVMNTLEKRHVMGIGKVFYTKNLTLQPKAADTIVLPTDTLLQHIRLGMVEDVHKDIQSIFRIFRHKEYLPLESARMVTTELAITAFKGEVSVKDQSVSYLFYLNRIQQMNTLDEMEEDITGLAVQIAERRKSGGNHKKRTAQQALEYLRNNYADETLSLNDVAEYLNISIPYLAVLFKQETNQNFSAHLLEIRMEKAKELLRTTGKTVSEISEMIGYSSAQYFAVCFKKYTGVSPGSYREQP